MTQTAPRLGKYEILEEIGRGGFAVVYRARDTVLKRDIALKVLHPQLTTDPKFVQRFHQEGQAAAGMHHPHIVTIYEVGEEANQHYLAMAFLPGCPLDKRLSKGPLPAERAVSIIEQIAEALDGIHEQGLVHRDIKPANIMVDDAQQATLLDFGIVRAAEGTRLTTTMAVLGTPTYMAPEQAELEEAGDVDWRADVYALGIVVYEMLVGRPPFIGKSPTAILHKHVYEAPPLPTALRSDLSPGLEPVLLKALAKRREDRFQHAGDLAAGLRQALQAEEQARRQEAQLAPLYQSLQAAAARDDWAEVLALGGQIRGLDSGYRDAPQLVEQAKKQMRRSTRPALKLPQLPAWAWAVGALVLAGVLFLILWATGIILGPSTTTTPIYNTSTPEGPPTTTSLYDTRTRSSDKMVMVYVPGGEFEMGSTEGISDEQPVHTVALDGFWIDKYEVTNAQFIAFLNEQGNQEEGEVTWLDLKDENSPILQMGDKYQLRSGYANRPVFGVSWYGAQAYCGWVEARLPTEAQWEYAAHGSQRFIYPWGDKFDCLRGNFDDETELDDYVVPGEAGCDGYERTAPVGSFASGASWCGALDMAGNVWEWVADWYGDYPSAMLVNPIGPNSGDFKVLRGGSWGDDPTFIRTADRNRHTPVYYNSNVGFRCAVVPWQ